MDGQFLCFHGIELQWKASCWLSRTMGSRSKISETGNHEAVHNYHQNDITILFINIFCFQIEQPSCIQKYNLNMGGTDRMDENIGKYRINIRCRKWYWAIMTWCFDVAICNAWQLLRQSGSDMSQLEFRRSVAVQLLKTHGKPPHQGRQMGAVASDKRVSNAVRFDQMGYFLAKTPGGKQWRCASQFCIGRPTTMCTKCRVRLCLKCFQPWHDS